MSASNPKLFNVGELSIGAEATYNTTSGSLQHVRCISCDVTGLDGTPLTDDHMKQADYSVPVLMGPKVGTITTTHHIAGWTTNDDPGAPSIANPPANGVDMLISAIASVVGNVTAGGKETITGSDATTITAGTGSIFIGSAMCWDSASGHQVGWNTNASGGTITLTQTVDSNQLSTDSDLHGSYTIYKTTGAAYHDNNDNVEGYTLQLLGHETDDKIVASGCLPTGLSMSFPVGELPTMTLTWGVGGWVESGSGSGFAGFSNGAAPATWAGAAPQAVMNGLVTRGASMGAAGALRISSLEIDIQAERPAIADPSATNGIGGFGPLRTTPKISFSVFRSHAGDVDRFLDQDGDIYSFRFGSSPGSMIGILVPVGRLISYPTKGESDGAVTSDLELYCNHYAGDTGSTPTDQNTPVDSDFRIAFC